MLSFFPLIIFRQQEADVTTIFWWGELKLTLSSEQTIDVNIRDHESDVVAFFLLVKRHKTIPGCNIFGVCENVTNSCTESVCTTRLATPWSWRHCQGVFDDERRLDPWARVFFRAVNTTESRPRPHELSLVVFKDFMELFASLHKRNVPMGTESGVKIKVSFKKKSSFVGLVLARLAWHLI